jgi:glycine/D-amino acid oxidase-like deaminating enzyme
MSNLFDTIVIGAGQAGLASAYYLQRAGSHATTVSTGDCNMRNFTFVTSSMLPFANSHLVSESPGKPVSSGPSWPERWRALADVKRFKLMFPIVHAGAAAENPGRADRNGTSSPCL